MSIAMIMLMICGYVMAYCGDTRAEILIGIGLFVSGTLFAAITCARQDKRIDKLEDMPPVTVNVQLPTENKEQTEE